MTRVYRDRPGFVRPYWMLAGLCGFGSLLSALTLFPASSGLTAVVGSLALLASGASAAAMLMILLRFRLLPFAVMLVLLTGASVALELINGVRVLPADIVLQLVFGMAAYGLGLLLIRLFKGRDQIAAVVLAALYPFLSLCSLRSVPNYLILSRLGLLDILLTILLPAVVTAALAAAGWFALDRLLRSDFAHLTQPCAAGEPKKGETL